MSKLIGIFWIGLILMTTSVLAVSEGYEVIEGLKWVEKADPIKDAEQAIMKKDFRFLGISGRGTTVPGLPEEAYWEYTKKYGVNVIKGTSDVIWGDEHLRLIRIAEKYAMKYNQILFEHLSKMSGK